MIIGYVGMFGYGKTLWMVHDTMKEMMKGRRVISNTPISFDSQGKHYEAEYIENRNQFMAKLISEEDCIFVIDEAGLFLPNNYWDKMPFELTAKLMQSRKYRCDFFYTVQRFGHATIKLRDLTNILVKCFKRRFLGFFDILYYAVEFDPELAELKLPFSSPLAKDYIISTKALYPSNYRRVYPAYDTMFKVVGSLLAPETQSVDLKVDPTAFVERKASLIEFDSKGD